MTPSLEPRPSMIPASSQASISPARIPRSLLSISTLRLLEVYNPQMEKIWVLITNNHDLGVTTLAVIYKDRWQIETFFRTLKQSLKIKTFVGTNANAVKVRVWTALIAMLILRFLQLGSQFKWSHSNLVALLRMNLFTHRDLWAWLNEPFETPPVPYEPEQLPLALV
jgi:hypothetical protein